MQAQPGEQHRPSEGVGATAPLVSVVVPVYRSGEQLYALYARLHPVLDAIDPAWELILVDDASGDGTFEVMLALRQSDPRVRLIRFARNAGQQHATLCGLTRARGRYVITLDDDLQNPPEEIPRFIERLRDGDDLVIGRIAGGKQHKSYRNLGSRMVQTLAARIVGKPDHIALSSYRGMSRRAVDSMASYAGAHIYLPALMFSAVPTDRISNIAVPHHARGAGQSTYTTRKLFKLASNLLINYSSLPLRAVTLWGFFVSIASVAYAAWIALRVFLHGSPISGWPTVVVLVAFLSGNIMLCLGVLGEYIGRLVQENSRLAQFPVYEEHG
jgi:undecaprenyl-phosphate 4-deoxy-4-formamido-L-arabinose transferase